MSVTAAGYVLLGLSAIFGALVALVTFSILRFTAATRSTRQASRAAGGDAAMMAAALQDAVARLKAQERATAARAEASERLSEEIVSSLTAGLVVTALDGDIRILNPAGRRMLGLSERADAEEIRRVVNEWSLADIIQECTNSGAAIVRRTVSIPEPRHGVSHLGVTVSPLWERGEQLHGAICLFTDLTGVKDLEQQLRLKDSLATVGELTAGIAHEFRNGLATIQGYSKLLDLDALPNAYRPYVEGIRAETESLSQVVTNFLTFARPAELVLSRVDLRAICERAADEIRSDVRLLGGEVQVRGEFAIVDGDEVLLRQAFSNLLRNALDACAGASIRPRILVQSEIDETQKISRLSVNDNGPGIPPAIRERVFTPFFTSKRNGTGLGLALVQKVVVFHNGRVVVGPSAHGGASLQVTLPLAHSDSRAGRTRANIASGSGR